MRVDRQAGVIRGVKVLGLESRNGRTYLPEALAQAAPLYEDAKVNVNHPKGNPGRPRDYQDRIGTHPQRSLRAGEGLFADFYFNPKHALAEQLMWDAEHAPENVGFSHNVEARVGRRGERVVGRGDHPRAERRPGGRSGHDARPVRGVRRQRCRAGGRRGNRPPATLEELQREIRNWSRASAGCRRRRSPGSSKRWSGSRPWKRSGKSGAWRGGCCGEFDLPEPEAADPWATGRRQPAVSGIAPGGARRAGDAGLVEERARAGADACRRRRSRAPPTPGRNPAINRSVYAAGPLDAKSFVEAIT